MGLLKTIATGGVWPLMRIAEGRPEIDTICPHCKTANQTHLHMIWTCPLLKTAKSPAIQRSQYLVGRATLNYDSCPGLYIRGIVPQDWISSIPGTKEMTEAINDYHTNKYIVGDIYLDGSGGKRTKDPRTRRVGWAWVESLDPHTFKE